MPWDYFSINLQFASKLVYLTCSAINIYLLYIYQEPDQEVFDLLYNRERAFILIKPEERKQ